MPVTSTSQIEPVSIKTFPIETTGHAAIPGAGPIELRSVRPDCSNQEARFVVNRTR
jgi:hypothetical protein